MSSVVENVLYGLLLNVNYKLLGSEFVWRSERWGHRELSEDTVLLLSGQSSVLGYQADTDI